jgi:hypothetical protein
MVIARRVSVPTAIVRPAIARNGNVVASAAVVAGGGAAVARLRPYPS